MFFFVGKLAHSSHKYLNTLNIYVKYQYIYIYIYIYI